MKSNPIRVLIIDDSAVARQITSDHLNRDPGINVIATARDPIVAERKIERNRPDIILLDIEMPRMNGLTFLKSLRKKSSIPVIIFSGYSEHGSDNAIKALELGAVAVMCKPQGDEILETMEELIALLKGVIKAKSPKVEKTNRRFSQPIASAKTVKKKDAPAAKDVATHFTDDNRDRRIIAIGASTGGTDAIRDVLLEMPNNCPPIMVVIHMPKGFTYRFAQRLNGICGINVREAQNGEPLQLGLALIAPGDQHLVLSKRNGSYVAVLQSGPRVKRHRPSVEVLFHSVAKIAKHSALGIILTGMGSDGAQGLNEMHRVGANTIAQDEESSIVFGMPKEAIKLGGVDEILGLDQIPEYCKRWMHGSY